MAKPIVVLMVFVLMSLCLYMCRCSKEQEDGEEKTQSWTDLVSEKVSEGVSQLRLDRERKTNDDDQDVISKAEEFTAKVTESVSSAVSDSSKFVSDKAGAAVNWAESEASANNSSGHDDNQAPAQLLAGTGSGYKQAQQNLEEVRPAASEKAKRVYEAAKENLSDAVGALGTAMRGDNGEL